MARVGWSREALAGLASIRMYVGQFDPRAAVRLADRLFDAGNGLRDFPTRGRPAANGCRALLTVRPYVILYEVAEDDVLILSVRHGAQIAAPD